MRDRFLIYLMMSSLLVAGCLDSTSQGTFHVVFTWEGGPPQLTGTEWVSARLEERSDLATPGPVKGTAGPQEFVISQPLDFTDIPNGDNLVVIVELRDGPDANSNVLYYGISQFFSLKPGKHTEVEVYMQLKAVPGDEHGGVEILEGELVNNSQITLVLTTDTGERVKVSHFVSFPPDKTDERPLSDLDIYPGAPPGLTSYRMDWSLDFNPVYECSHEDYCPRRVFVRFVDAHGYESRTVYDDVNFDRNPPALVDDGVSVTPRVANIDDRVSVCLTFTEQVVADPVLSVDEVSAFTFYKIFPSDDEPSNSYCFASTGLAGDLGSQDGTYNLSVSMIDRATNQGNELQIGMIEVDSTDPEISEVVIVTPGDTGYANLADRDNLRDLSITFNLSEAPGDAYPKVLVGPNAYPDPCSCIPVGLGNEHACTCGFTLGARDTDGVKIVSIFTTDLAGNATEDTGTSVSFDFTRPSLVPDSVSLHYEPESGNVQPVVHSAKSGTTVRVYFTVSEILGGDPVVDTNGSPSFDLADQVGNSYDYDCLVATPGNQDFTVRVSVMDLAGNSIDPDPTSLGMSFTVDNQIPDKPDVDTFESIIFTRKPWGPDSCMNVSGLANSVEGYATIIFYTEPGGREIDRGQTSANGSFGPFDLNVSDRPEIFVSVADDAGNETEALRVRDVIWVASLGANSPLQFEERTWFSHALFQTKGLEVPDLANLMQADSQEEIVAGYSPGWTQYLYEMNGPTARAGHSMAYDSARDRMVVFGGSDGTYNDQTWEWDGRSWKLVCGVGTYCVSPAARAGHSMEYDAVRGVVVMFGGEAGSTDLTLGDTWEWDGTKWLQQCGDGTNCSGPPGRSGHGMVYDSERGRVLLFGGCENMDSDTFECLNMPDGLWAWDGAGWDKICGSGTGCSGPTGSYHLSMAYDENDDELVLFSGCTVFNSNCQARSDETWRWNGTSWSKVCDASQGCTSPSSRYRHEMVYDAGNDRVMLFGGRDSTSLPPETWEWDGNSWSIACDGGPSCPAPHQCERPAMAYNRHLGEVVLFGGAWSWTPGTRSDKVWHWNGSRWKQIFSVVFPPERPSARHDHAMADDPDRERVVLFGGLDEDDSLSNETWEWEGDTWTLISSGGPSARKRHAMAYEQYRNRTLLFGGFDGSLSGETWEWSGTGWIMRCDTGAGCSGPSPRYGHAMVTNSSSTVLLFGGCTNGDGNGCNAFSDDTWQWNGQSRSWTKVCGSNTGCPAPWPTGREGHGMAWNRDDDRVVLFGGCEAWGAWWCSNVSDEVWEWTGAGWIQQCGSGTQCSGPEALAFQGMTFDAGRSQSLMFGGVKGNIIYFDTWEWGAGDWNMVCGAGQNCTRPDASLGQAMVFDEARRETIMFGGWYNESNDETWRWDGGSSAWPGQVLVVPFQEAIALMEPAGWPDPFDCLRNPSECQVRQVNVDWISGGESDNPTNPGNAQNGSQLLVWSDLGWIPLDLNSSGTGSPTNLGFSFKSGDPPVVSSAKQIGRLFHSDTWNLYFAVTPIGANGQLVDMASVSSDYVEVTVQYRLDP
ncbi:MAG: hypothetical protein JRJ87_15125 [Deltaproteobacteria bacterium]|nr:hypothetical protein [Deltaproteobacteria bacterium]